MTRHILFSIISGILLGFSWPTSGFTPLVFFGLIPLLISEDFIIKDNLGKKNLRVFFYSFIAFLTWNIITTWWIINSSVLGVIFANIINTSLYSLVFFIYSLVKRKLGINPGMIFLITLWISFEKFHLNWQFSWPWLNLGNVFSERVEWIQWYEYTGVFGGSLWVLLSNCSMFLLVRQYDSYKKKNRFYLNAFYRVFFIILSPIIISYLIISPSVADKYNVEDKFKVILTQPNIDPWDAKFVKTNTNLDFFKILKDLSEEELIKEYDFLVAPETYFAEGIGENVDYFQYTRLSDSINSFLKKFPNTNFISGISLYKTYQNSEKSPTRSANKVRENIWIDYYNSAINISSNRPFEVNHKTKLVVGTEFMPYKWILEPLIGNLMIDLGGTIVSKASQPISELNVFEHSKKDLKTVPIICYETVYGEFVSSYTKKGGDFITIISNDAWWGNTAGHKQLLSYARLRAIENRRYIVRSANSGISSIIDHKGKILSTLEYGKYGILTGTAEKVSGKTFYNNYGDFIARVSIFISISMILILFVTSNKNFNYTTPLDSPMRYD